MPRISIRDVRNVAAKLRVTVARLGGVSQKELCVAFRQVNPHTEFHLDRSYKWTQGRALPRSAAVYEDWAAVLGLDRPGAWIAAAPLEAFIDALCRDSRTDRATLLRHAGLDAATAERGATDEAHGLCGVYACYSRAQSPYHDGQVIRGALAIQPAPREATGLVACYSQALGFGRSHVAGPVLAAARTLTLPLTQGSSRGVPPVSFHLHMPAPPASLLAGIMSSCTMVHPSGQPPYATRIVMMRVPLPVVALEASNRYMVPGRLALSRDLAALGLAMPDPEGLETQLDRFIHPAGTGRAGSDQIPMSDHIALGAACDRIWLGTLEARAGWDRPAAAE